MTLNTLKCNHLTPLDLKALTTLFCYFTLPGAWQKSSEYFPSSCLTT